MPGGCRYKSCSGIPSVGCIEDWGAATEQKKTEFIEHFITLFFGARDKGQLRRGVVNYVFEELGKDSCCRCDSLDQRTIRELYIDIIDRSPLVWMPKTTTRYRIDWDTVWGMPSRFIYEAPRVLDHVRNEMRTIGFDGFFDLVILTGELDSTKQKIKQAEEDGMLPEDDWPPAVYRVDMKDLCQRLGKRSDTPLARFQDEKGVLMAIPKRTPSSTATYISESLTCLLIAYPGFCLSPMLEWKQLLRREILAVIIAALRRPPASWDDILKNQPSDIAEFSPIVGDLLVESALQYAWTLGTYSAYSNASGVGCQATEGNEDYPEALVSEIKKILRAGKQSQDSAMSKSMYLLWGHLGKLIALEWTKRRGRPPLDELEKEVRAFQKAAEDEFKPLAKLLSRVKEVASELTHIYQFDLAEVELFINQVVNPHREAWIEWVEPSIP